MAKSGELKEIWDVAQKTNLQFNMVRGHMVADACIGSLHKLCGAVPACMH